MDTARIKELRIGLGLTQEQAAAKAGLSSKQHWCNIERGRQGRIGNVSVAQLEAIARVLGVTARDLLTEPTAKR